MLMAARSLLRPLTFASIRVRARFASVYGEHRHPNGNRTSLLCISFVFTFTALAAWKQRLSLFLVHLATFTRNDLNLPASSSRYARVSFFVRFVPLTPSPPFLLPRVTLNGIINWLFFLFFSGHPVRWYLRWDVRRMGWLRDIGFAGVSNERRGKECLWLVRFKGFLIKG